MPITPIISQLKPAAADLATIHTTKVIEMLDELAACNMDSNDDYIRFMINPAGSCSDDDSQYIFYDVKIKGNSTIAVEFGDWVPKGTIFKVYSLYGNVAFTLFTHTM